MTTTKKWLKWLVKRFGLLFYFNSKGISIVSNTWWSFELFFFACRHILTPILFLRLSISSSGSCPGHVSIMSLFNYTMRRVWLQQTRIGLSLYDYTGQGFLRESVGFTEIRRKSIAAYFYSFFKDFFSFPTIGFGVVHFRVNTNVTSIGGIREKFSQVNLDV